MEKSSSVATFSLQSSGSELVCVLCVCSALNPILLPLAVCVCAGKLVAYLCRAARDQQEFQYGCAMGEHHHPLPCQCSSSIRT